MGKCFIKDLDPSLTMIVFFYHFTWFYEGESVFSRMDWEGQNIAQ